MERPDGPGPTPADLAESRLANRSVPTETFDPGRLDLRTDEPTAPVGSDTPGLLTARGLAAVRREAGVGRFPDGGDILSEDVGWETWAEGFDDADGRMARLDDDLGRRTPRLARYAMRLLSAHDDPNPTLDD